MHLLLDNCAVHRRALPNRRQLGLTGAYRSIGKDCSAWGCSVSSGSASILLPGKEELRSDGGGSSAAPGVVESSESAWHRSLLLALRSQALERYCLNRK